MMCLFYVEGEPTDVIIYDSLESAKYSVSYCKQDKCHVYYGTVRAIIIRLTGKHDLQTYTLIIIIFKQHI